MKRNDALALRLVAQGLVGPPLANPVAAVRRLLAVPDPDAPVRGAGVAQRCGGASSDVASEMDAGTLVRSHALRPTWHLVAADDLPWMRALLAEGSKDALAARGQRLDLDDRTRAAALSSFASALADGPLSRRELQVKLQRDGVLGECSMLGRQVGHLLLTAELEGTVVASPTADGKGSTYSLAERSSPGAGDLSRTDALDRFVSRYVASHGPVSLGDLKRWSTLPPDEVADALGRLPGLAAVTVDGAELWHNAELPAADPVDEARGATLLLQNFDEAVWAYQDVGWPPSPGVAAPVATDVNGGVVLSRLRIAGSWQVAAADGGIKLSLSVPAATWASDHRVIGEAAERFVAAAAPGASIVVTTT